ncbi:hypothetical protein H5410_051189 [Solanum commersonii]|uniref:Uncharacterized protein n=1 Tax=Solanum commersonii TaxID=4109 RepID=A0A9J5WXR0_SOLCO|nr:hypothetical protein H5410_051189 [Solanum commersonii]
MLFSRMAYLDLFAPYMHNIEEKLVNIHIITQKINCTQTRRLSRGAKSVSPKGLAQNFQQVGDGRSLSANANSFRRARANPAKGPVQKGLGRPQASRRKSQNQSSNNKITEWFGELNPARQAPQLLKFNPANPENEIKACTS